MMLKSRRLLVALGKIDLGRPAALSSNFPVNYLSRIASQKHDSIVASPWKSIDIPDATLPEFVFENSSKWADKVAVECGLTGKGYTYDELRINSKRLACALLKAGLNRGDTVTLLLPNMPEYAVSYYGVMEAGLTLSAINPLYSADEIAHQLTDSGSKYIICHHDSLEKALTARNLLERNLHVICVNDFDGRTREIPSCVRPFSDLISPRDISDLEKQAHPVAANETTAFLPYSSGTTGLPKGVCLTHKNLVANVAQITHNDITINQPTTKDHQDSVIAVLPFFHIYGSTVSLSRTLREGGKVVTLPKFEPASFLNSLSTNKNIVLYAAPPMIIFLASHPSATEKHLKHLRITMTGGAPCSDSDLEKLFDKKKHVVIQGYGLTESAPVLTHSHQDYKDRASTGAIVSNTLAKVVDTETGKDLPAGETGELCFKGPQIMKCYHNRPEATAETIDKDGWLHTGDVGYINELKNCFIVDRKKELIKVKGFQVPPAELESILRQHPKLYDAGVTSLPCSRNGEVPVAFVVPNPGNQNIKEEEIKDYVASKVAPYKKVSKVVFVDAIPKNPSGKILRRVLKEMIQTELQQKQR
ncbi:4-coumarate--CoA ligase 3-like isoform X1 [Cimex lectularius]|uniref:Luciferin 4-monooxygenase n=2 Tax=Cimex lectularius TaxID=79782 RepID=A0A8I6SNE2_CIMLE|nr:4-coumarate--CoA ligase 3-like isoform X1 [Cimex lectularius]